VVLVPDDPSREFVARTPREAAHRLDTSEPTVKGWVRNADHPLEGWVTPIKKNHRWQVWEHSVAALEKETQPATDAEDGGPPPVAAHEPVGPPHRGEGPADDQHQERAPGPASSVETRLGQLEARLDDQAATLSRIEVLLAAAPDTTAQERDRWRARASTLEGTVYRLLAAGESVAKAADAQESVTREYRLALREQSEAIAAMTLDETAAEATDSGQSK